MRGKGRKGGRKGTLRREDSTLPSGGIPRRRVSLLFLSGHVNSWTMVSWLAVCPATPHRLSSGPSSGSHLVRSHWGHFKAAAMQAQSPDLSKDCVYRGALFSFASPPSISGEEAQRGRKKEKLNLAQGLYFESFPSELSWFQTKHCTSSSLWAQWHCPLTWTRLPHPTLPHQPFCKALILATSSLQHLSLSDLEPQ